MEALPIVSPATFLIMLISKPKLEEIWVVLIVSALAFHLSPCELISPLPRIFYHLPISSCFSSFVAYTSPLLISLPDSCFVWCLLCAGLGPSMCPPSHR
jgi:hypothetical protein